MFSKHPKFKVAVTGALAITAFSLVGGACTAGGAASASLATPSAVASSPVPVSTPAGSRPVAASMKPKPMPTSAGSTGTTTGKRKSKAKADNAALPRPDHVIVVLEENESPARLPTHAPYIAALARHGANFTNAYAETHPSEPNYLALFSGSTHGLTSDSCPHTYASANLGSELIAAGLTFTGYAESMPSDGYRGCSADPFARKHTPWVDFSNVPASSSLRFSEFPQDDFASLPTVSFVVPDLCNDMHDCPIAAGDAWLKSHLGAYASWAKGHNSLLIVTFDEADGGVPNRIPLVLYGDAVVTGTYTQQANHYSILRTLEDMYALPCTGAACDAEPLTAAFTH